MTVNVLLVLENLIPIRVEVAHHGAEFPIVALHVESFPKAMPIELGTCSGAPWPEDVTVATWLRLNFFEPAIDATLGCPQSVPPQVGLTHEERQRELQNGEFGVLLRRERPQDLTHCAMQPLDAARVHVNHLRPRIQDREEQSALQQRL